MVTKKIAVLLLLFLGGILYAQPSGEQAQEKEKRSQKLEWKTDDNTLEYKVEIQNENGEILLSEITENNYIQFSLPAGNYTYKITAYDMLGRESVSTEWLFFEIITPQEEARRIRVAEEKRLEEERIAKEKAEAQRLEEERIALELAEQKRLEEERLEAERLAREKEEQERLEYERLKKLVEENPLTNPKALKASSYTEPDSFNNINANEGEEEALEEEDEKSGKKHFDWDRKFMLSAGATLPLTVYDQDFFKRFFDNALEFGANARLDILPFHKEKWRLGIEAAANYVSFKKEISYYNLNVDTYMLNGFAVYRHTLISKKIWWQMKAGAGITVLNKKLEFKSLLTDKQNSSEYYAYINAAGGLSFIIFPVKFLSFEIGADFYNIFIPDMNTGFLYPYVCLGLSF